MSVKVLGPGSSTYGKKSSDGLEWATLIRGRWVRASGNKVLSSAEGLRKLDAFVSLNGLLELDQVVFLLAAQHNISKILAV